MPFSSSQRKHGRKSVPPPPIGVRWIGCPLDHLVTVYFRVEVEHMDQPRLLTGHDGTYFGFEVTKLPGVDRARAVDGDRDLPRRLLTSPRAGKDRSRCDDGCDGSSCNPTGWFPTKPCGAVCRKRDGQAAEPCALFGCARRSTLRV